MELRVLRYFYTVAREGNITRAAQLLHVTQPTLSRQLMQLEEELGTVLFHRSSHRIVLTEDGMLLKRRAQELLELVREDCPLAALPCVTPEDLLPYPLLLSWRDQVNEQVREWFGECFSKAKMAARYNLVTNTAIMVKHRVGLALCFDLGTTYYNSLRLVPLSPALENGAVLALKKEQARSRAVEQFIAHIRNALEA